MTDSGSVRTARRRPGTALVLSLILPGLGHVYCGRIARGIVILFIEAVLSPGVYALLGPNATWRTVGVLSLVLGTAVWIYAMVDARRIARKIPPDYALKDYNRWYVYLCLVLLGFPATVGQSLLVRRAMFQAFYIVNDAMQPTLRVGDRVIVSKLAYRYDPVRTGDVVVFPNPNDPRRKVIRRIVALAGDTVEMRGGELYINDTKLACMEVDDSESTASPGKVCEEVNGPARYRVIPDSPRRVRIDDLRDFPKTTIPNGHCFVLGDNRNRSRDSRSFGPVRLADLIGRVDRVWYPRWEKLSPQAGDD